VKYAVRYVDEAGLKQYWNHNMNNWGPTPDWMTDKEIALSALHLARGTSKAYIKSIKLVYPKTETAIKVKAALKKEREYILAARRNNKHPYFYKLTEVWMRDRIDKNKKAGEPDD
jgi:hypothetical protein